MKKEILDNLRGILDSEKNFESELFVSSGRALEVSLKEGALENLEFSSGEGMGLRVFRKNKSAFAYSNTVSAQGLKELFRQTGDMIAFAEADLARKLPENDAPDNRPEPEIFDKNLFGKGTQDIIDELKRQSASALKYDSRIKKVLRAGYSQAESSTVIVNSAGLFKSEVSTGAGYGISVVAQAGADTRVGSSHTSKRFYDDLDFGFATDEACMMGCSVLNAGKIASGKRSVLMHPSVAAEFLDLIADVLSADAVQKKRSFLSGCLGRKTASDVFSLVDDPLLPRGAASGVFDDEGAAANTLEIFDAGVLRNLFYDSYTARKEQKKSTGNASRGSYKGVPAPGASNLYIKPGNKSFEELISGIKSGVYVLDVMGMHMADTVSGDFSVGVAGIAVENGRLAKPVSGLTLAGNLRQFLANIREIGNDIIFYGSLGSPSIVAEGLMIGG